MFDRFGAGSPSPFGVRGGALALGVHAAILAYGLHTTTGSADPGKPVVDTTVFMPQPPRRGVAVDVPVVRGPVFTGDGIFAIPTDIPTIPGGTNEPGPILTPSEPLGSPPDGDATGVYDSEVVEQMPELLSSPPPRYPEMLRLAHVEGVVIVQGVVDTLGRMEHATLRVLSSPHPAFSASALESLAGAVFRPGRVYGHAVRVLVQVPVRFTLERR